MKDFQFFDTIFNDVSLFLDVSVQCGDQGFHTTSIADDAADLRETVTNTVFGAGMVLTIEQQSIVDSLITSFNDREIWTYNSITNWPMMAVAAYDSGLVCVTIRLYTMTDGNRKLDTEIVEASAPEPANAIMQSVMSFAQEAVRCDGFAFVGYADPEGILAVLAGMTEGKDYAALLMSPARGRNTSFAFSTGADTERLAALEASFISEMVRDVDFTKLPTFHSAVSDHGITHVRFVGQRDLTFMAIQPITQALIGIRTLEIGE